MDQTTQFPAAVRGVIESARRLGLEADVKQASGCYYFSFKGRDGRPLGVAAFKGVRIARVALQFYGIGFQAGHAKGLSQRSEGR